MTCNYNLLTHKFINLACVNYSEQRSIHITGRWKQGSTEDGMIFQVDNHFVLKRSSGLVTTGTVLIVTHMARISTFYHHLHEQLKPVQKESIIQKQNVSCGKPHQLELRLMKCRAPATDNGAQLTVCDCMWESLPEQMMKWKACPVNARTNKNSWIKLLWTPWTGQCVYLYKTFRNNTLIYVFTLSPRAVHWS